MFCTKCGLTIEERDRFCSQCGTPTGRGVQQPLGAIYNRLSRPREDRKLAGVCSGIARYMGIDPTLVRILMLALAVWGGIGVIVYIVCWFVMPRDPYMLPAAAPPVPMA